MCINKTPHFLDRKTRPVASLPAVSFLTPATLFSLRLPLLPVPLPALPLLSPFASFVAPVLDLAWELLVPFVPVDACVAAVSIEDLVVVRDVGLEIGAELAAFRARPEAFCTFAGDCDRVGERDSLGDEEGGRFDLSVSFMGLADIGNGAGGGGIFGRAGETSGF